MPADFLNPVLLAELLGLGLVAGFLAGLLGIGGGMMMVPFITMMLSARGMPAEFTVKVAIASSMAVILFTSISSARAHHKRGAVRWDIVRGLVPGLLVGGLIASLGIFSIVKGQALAFGFALFVAFSATQMGFGAFKPKAARTLPGPLGQGVAGTAIGTLSGLVGAGGGFISVPYMTWCNVPIHNAVATSAALGFPIALFNVIGYVWSGSAVHIPMPGMLGWLWWPAVAVLGVCGILAAPWGARAAHALPVEKLKRVFAGLLYLLAAYMLWKGFAG